MYNYRIIESRSCLYARDDLLRALFVYVQWLTYRSSLLLTCRPTFIDGTFCLYALVAYVQRAGRLLFIYAFAMCSFIIIEPFGCLCAIRFLLNTPYCLCAVLTLLSVLIACVQ